MKKTDFLPLFAVAFVFAGLIGVSYVLEPEPVLREPEVISVTVLIEPDENAHRVSVPDGSTVLYVLQTIDEKGDVLKLETQTYEGLGTLVTSMKGLKNGTQDQYWQYEVNGVMPQIGADQYPLKNRDEIVWQFDESEY